MKNGYRQELDDSAKSSKWTGKIIENKKFCRTIHRKKFSVKRRSILTTVKSYT